MKYIDIRFEFEVDQEILEEESEEYYDLIKISRLDTNLPKDARYTAAEILAQSDSYWTEHCWKIIELIGD